MTGKTDELLAAMGIGTTAAPPTSTTAPLYAGRLLSTVEPEHVQWLWQDWLPLGALTVLDGIPGAGKSTIMYDLAARVSTGRPMPTGPQEPREPAGVVLLTAEDPLGPVVRPRLDAAGADPGRVFALEGAARPTDTGEMVYRPLVIPDDVPALEAAVADHGATLVVVDVFTAYLSGGHDSYKDADVRRALAPLAAMAEATGSAVVLIRHPRKSGGTAQQSGGGSIAIGGASRSWLAVGHDPNDDTKTTRVLAPVRTSLVAPPRSLTFAVTASLDGSSGIEWAGESSLGADDLYAPTEQGEALTAAKDWLREYLSDGEVSAEILKGAATREGHSWRTVQRARDAIGAQVRREGSGKQHRSCWSLVPGPEPERTTADLGTSGDTPPDQAEHPTAEAT